jgi:hypothetical protein
LKARPSSGRRSPLVPIDDEETQRVERAQGDVIARRLLDRDRAAAGAGAGAGAAGAAGAGAAGGEYTPAGPGRPEDTVTRKVAALRSGGYLPTSQTPERDAQPSTPNSARGGGFESGDATRMTPGRGGGGGDGGDDDPASSPTPATPADDIDPAVAAAQAAAAAAGVPLHLAGRCKLNPADP